MKKGIFALLLVFSVYANASVTKVRHHVVKHAAPAATQVHPTQGKASWYGVHEQGRKMANGKPFDRWKFTCASRWLPLGSKIKVTNVKSGAETVVEVTDRGPVLRSRILDLSEAAAREIGCIREGVCTIVISNDDQVSTRYEDGVAP